jgi:hypothetical protein
MLVPFVESGFGRPDGLGHREFRLDVGRGDDCQSGSQRAVIEPRVKQGGSQSLDGDAVAVGSRDALGEAVQAQTTQVVGDRSGADLARLRSEQGSEVLAEIFVGGLRCVSLVLWDERRRRLISFGEIHTSVCDAE